MMSQEEGYKQIWGITEETECCLHCKHFYQHYVNDRGFAFPIHMGHCVRPRMKYRKIYDVCEIFERREEP